MPNDWSSQFSVLAKAPDGIMFVSDETRIVEVNDTLCRITGHTREQLLSMCIADLEVQESQDEVQRHAKTMLERGGDLFRTRWRRADGAHIHVEVSTTLSENRKTILAFVRDLSDLVEARIKLERSQNFLAYLSHANALVAQSEDLDVMYQQLCRLATELDSRIAVAWVSLVAPGVMPIRVTARSGPAMGFLDEVEMSLDPLSPLGQGPVSYAIRENRLVLVSDFQHDPMTQPWHRQAASFGLASIAAMPFRRARVPCGALVLCSAHADVFDSDLARLINELGDNVSHALDFARHREEREQALNALRESREQLEMALDGANESIWTWNLDTNQAYWSPGFYRSLGYADLEFPGTAEAWLAHMHPDDSAHAVDSIKQQLTDGSRILALEYRFRAKNGDWRWIRGHGQVVETAADGHPVKIAGTNVDFTDARYVQELHVRNAERGLALIRFAEKSESLNEDQLLTYGLEEAERLTGSAMGFLHFVNDDQETLTLVTWTARTLTQCQAAHDTHYPISSAGVWADAFRQRRPVVVNDYAPAPGTGKLPDGHAELKRLISVPIIEGDKVKVIAGVGNKREPYLQDDVDFLLLMLTDLWRTVQRARAERELRQALNVIETSPVVSFRWGGGDQWPLEHVSANISRWGYTREQLHAASPRYVDIIHPDDAARVIEEAVANAAAGTIEYISEHRVRHADGQYFWVELHIRIVRDDLERVLWYDGVANDIHAKKLAEQSLTAALEHQRKLNIKLEEAQNQLLQSEKMASIGQLAAGVAHELNNPIGFVHSNLGTLETYIQDIFEISNAWDQAIENSSNPQEFARVTALKAEKDFAYLKSDIYSLMTESKDGLARVKKIVQDLKDFSRVGEAEWQWADLHKGLDSTLNIAWNELKYKCTVTKHYAENLPQIHCLPSQLNQVFMNLLVNAAHSIATKGDVTITTRLLGTDAVQIAISDTGCGIPPENMKHLFEPFFTTKPVGKGTGLGLSIAYGIVGKHQGKIEVHSEVGTGSVFTITLPVNPATEVAAGNEYRNPAQ